MKFRNVQKVSDTALDDAANIIKDGGVVAFPTDTLYGLAANPFNLKAVDRIFKIKKRLRNSPILILISAKSELEHLIEDVPDAGKKMMEKFWPGPLTIVFPGAKVSSEICGGGNTVGVRLPLHNTSLELVRRAGTPLTATSANISGTGGALSAQEVFENIGQEVDLILDGGASQSIHSTVISVVGNGIKLIREGCISKNDLSCVDFYLT